MKALPFGILGIAVLVGATYRAPENTAVPPATRAKDEPVITVESRLLSGYDSLFNDTEALKRGEFGISRAVIRPFNTHQNVVGKAFKGSSLSGDAKLDAIRESVDKIRTEAKETFFVEEGVISVLGKQRSPISLWQGDFASTGPKLFSKMDQYGKPSEQFLELATDLRSALGKDPKADVTRNIDGWIIKARTVFFRHQECLTCHRDSKVGDPAAITAVATKKREK